MFNCEVGRLSDRLYRDLAVPFKIRLEITFLQIRVEMFVFHSGNLFLGSRYKP